MATAWFIKALDMKKENPNLTYREISEALNVSYTTVKKAFSRNKKKEPEETVTSQILKELSKEKTIKELCEKFRVSPKILHVHLEELVEAGYNVHQIEDRVKLVKTVIPVDNVQECKWNGEKIIRFGVAGDKQFGSIYQQETHLQTMYDIFKSEGIADVYDPGDLSDGYKMRPGHEFELFAHGADGQEDYIVKHHPYRNDITTHFILGNHDASHIKNGGRDIGRGIALRRPDMKYLGMYNAKIPLTPKCIMEINHPLDGAAYALSYSIQKYADSMSGGDKPDILLNGHHHKALYMFYRNIHMFETGCFQAQTSFERGKRIAVHIGGWIVEIHVRDDGTVWRCKGEFFPFYDIIKNDY